MNLSIRSVLSVAILLAASSAHAGVDCTQYNDASDKAACDLYTQAQTLWAERGDLKKAADATALLEKAEAQAKDSELKFDVLVLASRAYYWQGVNVPGSEENNDKKVPVFEAGRKKGDAAIALKADYAEGYYLASINMGKWGLAKGKLTAASPGNVKALKRYLGNAMRKTTKSGGKGEEQDFFGPYRVYGKMNIELPGIVGGDLDEGLTQLKTAYESPTGKTHVLNVAYYAQALVKKGGSENGVSRVEKAKKILTEVVSYKGREGELNVVRTPETKLEMEEAEHRLADLNR